MEKIQQLVQKQIVKIKGGSQYTKCHVQKNLWLEGHVIVLFLVQAFSYSESDSESMPLACDQCSGN